MDVIFLTGLVLFLFGIVCAKWALELGYSQMTQILIFILALFLGPLVLFGLYNKLIYSRKISGLPGIHFFGARKETNAVAGN
ncbi:hypothetical protein SAMN02745866_01150 [Alteromonadaceae bacterium Bs31]|nr:hypothetical protein SAMN02745866_01150 [Alteromonadaceae bacterium Bs31]